MTMACARACVSAVPLLVLPPTNWMPFIHSNSSVRLDDQLLNCMGACVLRSVVPYTTRPYWILGMWVSDLAGAWAEDMPLLAGSTPLVSASSFLSKTSIHLRAVLLLVAAAAVASTSSMMRVGPAALPAAWLSCCCGSKFPEPSKAAADDILVPCRAAAE